MSEQSTHARPSVSPANVPVNGHPEGDAFGPSKPAPATPGTVELDDALVALLARVDMKQQHRSHGRVQGGRRRKGPTPDQERFVLPMREVMASQAEERKRLHERKRKEYLYAEHTPRVCELEAQLNAVFDEAIREHNPVVWPSVPLRPDAC